MAPDSMPTVRYRVPTSSGLWLVGLVAVAASGVTVALARGSGELWHRVLRVAAVNWVTLPFIVGGMIAWRRRPDSRFGPLMILAGFATPLGTLQWADNVVLNTVGQLTDLLPAALWPHVFLAYPDGRLHSRTERVLVASAYVVSVGGRLAVLLLGNFGVSHPLAVLDEAELSVTVQIVRLMILGALAIGAAVLLWRRRRASATAPLRPIARRIDAFGFAALVVGALVLITGVFRLPGFEGLRLTTLALAGLAPAAFLAGLLSSRLARSSVGDLLVELRNHPDHDLRELISHALRDPSVELAYWLPQYGTWTDQGGRPVVLPDPGPERSVMVIDSHDGPAAALVYDPSLDDDPALLAAVCAAAGIAVENGRLEAELRARGHPEGTPTPRTQPARRRAAAARRTRPRAGHARGADGRGRRGRPRTSQACAAGGDDLLVGAA